MVGRAESVPSLQRMVSDPAAEVSTYCALLSDRVHVFAHAKAVCPAHAPSDTPGGSDPAADVTSQTFCRVGFPATNVPLLHVVIIVVRGSEQAA